MAWYGEFKKDFIYCMRNNHPLLGLCLRVKHHPYLVKYRIEGFIGLLIYSLLFASISAHVDSLQTLRGEAEFFALRGVAFGGGFAMSIADSFMFKLTICSCAYDKNRKCFRFYTCMGDFISKCVLFIIFCGGIAGGIAICNINNVWTPMILLWLYTWISSWCWSAILVSVLFIIFWKQDMKMYRKYTSYINLINEMEKEMQGKETQDLEIETKQSIINTATSLISPTLTANDCEIAESADGKTDTLTLSKQEILDIGSSSTSQIINTRESSVDAPKIEKLASMSGKSIKSMNSMKSESRLKIEKQAQKELKLNKTKVKKFSKYNIPLWEYLEWKNENSQWNLTDNINNQNIIKINKHSVNKINNVANINYVATNIAFTDIPPPDQDCAIPPPPLSSPPAKEP